MSRCLFFLWVGIMSHLAFAADVYTEAMQKAYIPYRLALIRTQDNMQADALQALEQAAMAWQKVRSDFVAKAPSPYDRDARFAWTLDEIAALYVQATHETRQGQLVQANGTLAKIRSLLSDQRRRNNVIIYSDYVNAYWQLLEGVINETGRVALERQESVDYLLAQQGALAYLSDKLVQEAPTDYLRSAEFNELIKQQRNSVDDFRRALQSRDPAAIKGTINKLKSSYFRFFLKFG